MELSKINLDFVFSGMENLYILTWTFLYHHHHHHILS